MRPPESPILLSGSQCILHTVHVSCDDLRLQKLFEYILFKGSSPTTTANISNSKTGKRLE